MRRWLSSRAPVRSTEVDEIAQEVYLRLLSYSDEVLAENPQDHLFRIAAGVTNEWRKRSGDSSPDDIVTERAEQPLVYDQIHMAVSHLPQQQREALLLHVSADLTYRQVAARMRLTPRTARRDIVCGYVNLRYELRSVELGVISTG